MGFFWHMGHHGLLLAKTKQAWSQRSPVTGRKCRQNVWLVLADCPQQDHLFAEQITRGFCTCKPVYNLALPISSLQALPIPYIADCLQDETVSCRIYPFIWACTARNCNVLWKGWAAHQLSHTHQHCSLSCNFQWRLSTVIWITSHQTCVTIIKSHEYNLFKHIDAECSFEYWPPPVTAGPDTSQRLVLREIDTKHCYN